MQYLSNWVSSGDVRMNKLLLLLTTACFSALSFSSVYATDYEIIKRLEKEKRADCGSKFASKNVKELERMKKHRANSTSTKAREELKVINCTLRYEREIEFERKM